MVSEILHTRRFADFYEGALPFQMGYVPKGGMCLSIFLVLHRGEVHNVLLGKVNPNCNWVRKGALTKEETEKISRKWMLPSSHLLLFESPHSAAERVLKEQLRLGLGDIRAMQFQVYSEAYSRPIHWDLEFVLRGQAKRKPRSKNRAWIDLKFLDVRKLNDDDFARNHQDILAESGLR